MIIPMGRKYQIDYMFGLRYALSPKYRATVRDATANNRSLRVLYILGGLISIAVVTSAFVLLTLALRDIF